MDHTLNCIYPSNIQSSIITHWDMLLKGNNIEVHHRIGVKHYLHMIYCAKLMFQMEYKHDVEEIILTPVFATN
jgi:hypothetical protein